MSEHTDPLVQECQLLSPRECQLLIRLEQAEKALQEAGWSIVRTAVRYGPDNKDTHFSTHLSLTAVPTAGVTEDDILLDCQRELVVRSNVYHNSRDKAVE